MIAAAPCAVAEALVLARHGMRVHPLHGVRDGRCTCTRHVKCSNPGKHPRLSDWQRLATTDENHIQRWWGEWPQANAGIVTGSTSGVVVMDVDPRRGGWIGLELLEAEIGPLPSTPQSLTGGGGMHQLFRHPGIFVPDSIDSLFPGIEIKADGKGNGSNVVAPGSMHASGRTYEWEWSHHPNDTPLAPLPEALLALILKGVTEWTELTECTELTEIAPPAHSVHSVHSVTDAVKRSLPRSVGERHRQIFQFCRSLKTIAAYTDADPRKLDSEFRQWWTAALPTIGTKAWEDSWVDFVTAWPSAWPLTIDPVLEAYERAKQRVVPRCAEKYSCPDAINLIRLCAELQRSADNRPFYLSCRKAEQVLDVDRMTAWRRLKLLVIDDILKIAQKPTPNRATRYRYLADLPQEPAT